jgi:mitochondrial enoyl-[acyl-carrier protein] reductase / trans-2-enoyl-CoA reductase
MRQIQFHRIGTPAEVVECVDVADPAISAPDEILVRVEVFPINPADLLTLQGYYPRSDPAAPTLGVEALAVVEAVGSSVTDVVPGDRVILLSVDNWSERKAVKAHEVVHVSATFDALHLASLKVNPATAALLLTHFVDLQPGEWFLQNAANSAVGRAAIQIARSRGIKSANVVRRAEVAAELKRLGADIVLVDGDDLPTRLAGAANGAAIRLALDAVAGSATNRLASCLGPEGTLVIYGAMSGEAAAVNPGLMVFQDIAIRGFWLTRYLATAPRSDVLRLYADLEKMMGGSQFVSAVNSVFAAEDIKAAVKRAGEVDGGGKVFVHFRPGQFSA